MSLFITWFLPHKNLILNFLPPKDQRKWFCEISWRSSNEVSIKLRWKCIAELKALAFKPTRFRWYRCKTWSFHTVKPLWLLPAVELHLHVINAVFTPFSWQWWSSCLNYHPHVLFFPPQIARSPKLFRVSWDKEENWLKQGRLWEKKELALVNPSEVQKTMA